MPKQLFPVEQHSHLTHPFFTQKLYEPRRFCFFFSLASTLLYRHFSFCHDSILCVFFPIVVYLIYRKFESQLQTNLNILSNHWHTYSFIFLGIYIYIYLCNAHTFLSSLCPSSLSFLIIFVLYPNRHLSMYNERVHVR